MDDRTGDADSALCRAADPDLVSLLRAEPLFDASWYVAQCPDAFASGLDPAAHYLTIGAAAGYDPGPAFSSSRYLLIHTDVADAAVNPLVHYAAFGRAEGRAVRAVRVRRQVRPVRSPDRPCVLLVGHFAGAELFGAERSLLDLLDGFIAIGIDTVVAVPVTDNHSYLDELELRSTAVHTLKRHPGWPHRPVHESSIDELVGLIRRHQVDAVHVNTVVPHEGLLAARRCGVPAVMHAREIPFGDPDLPPMLGLTGPQDIVDEVLDAADFVIAPSAATASTYPLSAATSVVPNIVDTSLFEHLPSRAPGRVRIALVGSTSVRKGLLEFIAIARMFTDHQDASFVVVGPVSELVHELLDAGDLPGNLAFLGYIPTPAAAMAEADVVVNLSMCQESFARTLLEAMASGLPVVGHDLGGTPELVRDGVNGFLVPVGDRARAASCLEALVADPELRARMGAAGRQLVEERYSPESLATALAMSYRAILPGEDAKFQSVDDLVVPIPTNNHSPFGSPFFVGNRARIAYCSTVRFIDNDHLIVCSLVGREMHLVRLDGTRHRAEIVATLATTNGTHSVSVDLVDFDGDRTLVAANCEYSSVSLYRVEGGAVAFERSIKVHAEELPYCHGVAFMPGRPGIVCAAVTTAGPRVQFIDTDGTTAIDAFVQPGWRPKSITFVGPLMLVVSMRSTIGDVPRSAVELSQVALVEIDEGGGTHRLLDAIEFAGSVMDGCHAHGTTVYVADQMMNTVRVLEVVEGRLQLHADLEGFSFPHDVGVSPDGEWMAVANYGGNQLRVRRVRTAATS